MGVAKFLFEGMYDRHLKIPSNNWKTQRLHLLSRTPYILNMAAPMEEKHGSPLVEELFPNTSITPGRILS